MAALAVVWALLARSNFGPPGQLEVMAPLAVVLALAAGSALRSRADWLALARAGSAWGAAVLLVLLVRLAIETLAPVDPLDYFLAQARDDFSVFDFPRRWMPAAAGAGILLAAGFRTAWRTGRGRSGVAVATAAAVLGSLAYAVIVTLANTLPLASSDPLGQSPADLEFVRDVPSGLVPVLAMFATVIGAIGALLGRGAAAARQL